MQFLRGGKYGQPRDHVSKMRLDYTQGASFPNDAGLDSRCKFPDDAGLHTSQVESSAVHVLVALVKAERKRATDLENVTEFPEK